MTVETLFSRRKSVRAFKENPVSHATLEAILQDAARAPSWANTQPWGVVVVGGERLARLGEAFCQRLRAHDPPAPDLSMPGHTWPSPYGERIRTLGRALFECAGIPRDDEDARMAHYERMYRCFGAPHLILMTLDGSLTLPYPLLDIGAFVENLCLSAAERGLGTCILAAVARYPDTARKVLEIPAGQKIVVGVALGYEDEPSPYGRFRSDREPLENFVRWLA